jgi:hypothetical protein
MTSCFSPTTYPAPTPSSASARWASSVTAHTATPARRRARAMPPPARSPASPAEENLNGRFIRNDRLADAPHRQAQSALRASPAPAPTTTSNPPAVRTTAPRCGHYPTGWRFRGWTGRERLIGPVLPLAAVSARQPRRAARVTAHRRVTSRERARRLTQSVILARALRRSLPPARADSAAGKASAVDAVELARDPGALVRAEVDGHPGDVLAGAGASQRHARHEVVPLLAARNVV